MAGIRCCSSIEGAIESVTQRSKQQIPRGNDRKKSKSGYKPHDGLVLGLVNGEQGLEVEGVGVHGHVAGGVAGPLGFGSIPVKLYAVVVGVVEVEGFADAVVGGSVEGDVGGEEAAEGVGQGGACGVKNGVVVKAGGAERRGLATEGFPGVEADVVVVAPGGEEGCGVTHAHGDVEAEDAVVEGEGSVEVGYAEVNVTHAGLRMDGGCDHGVGRPLVGGGSLALASRATFHSPFTFFQKVM